MTDLIFPREMLMDSFVCYGQKTPIRAFDALDSTLVAQSPYPFVDAGRLVARFPGLPALKSAGINIFSPTKKGSE